jgi:hypothetical protein
MDSDYFGYWWRFSEYAMAGNHIRSAPGATLLRYNPWESFGSAAPRKKGGGGMLDRPYLSLIDYVDSIDGDTEWGSRVFSRQRRTAADWCNEHGSLGLFFVEVRQVTLYPRWEVTEHQEGQSGPFPTSRQFIRGLGKWTERKVPVGSNLEAILLPQDHRPVGGLVPEEFWDQKWEKPQALLQDVDSDVYYHQSIEDALGRFFPSVPKPERETYPYPVPASDEFWKLYAENRNDFVQCARHFADIVRALGRLKPADQMSDAETSRVLHASGALQSLAAHTKPALCAKNDGTFFHQWLPTSLIASYAMMALLDLAQGLVNVCDNCGRVFVSSAGRARFCSARCRKTSLQREWRARKAPAGT